ncbi:acyl-CoA thioesterase II [Acinetobacter suaedae]|uniref:Acyl-CoA thioesterase II n=1 Tax=Acinetobacter suaedae TaxID=2609668 RepID=A0A5P1UTG6_9GAMM|nr:acyl-CoA thioesterase domain-containing protein [Acinetobacter sp. C16S1]QER40239.1 acyl-CoA thioesterase II [Acinetobacter sp. C16S1]
MNNLTQELIELFNLRKVDDLLFQGQCTQIFGSHLFGGQLLGQALIAAARTTHQPAHSLHAYFLQSGVTNKPIIYQIAKLQDGKSFARREIKAIQDGKVIFIALASFTHNELGLDYQCEQKNEYLHPDKLISEQEHKIKIIDHVPDSNLKSFIEPFQIKIHPTHFLNPFAPEKVDNYAEYFKTYDEIPSEVDSIILHQAITAYYSDYNLLSISLLQHGLSYLSNNIMSASLDHAIYFHRPFRTDEWSLYELDCSTSSQGKGLNFGKIWQNEKLVCSTIQESLMRKKNR